jgi:D-aminopeptidase
MLPLIAFLTTFTAEEPPRRARDLGVAPGLLQPGPLNAITDVPGVRVGHVTLHEGRSTHTGATAVLPHAGNLFQDKVPGAVVIGNGFGKLAGSTQVQELGEIETPIVLTNTLAVPRAMDAILDWTLNQSENEGVRSLNALVGETNDGYLNDIRARTLTPATILRAIREAQAGPVQEGAVGAGSGTVCFGWKGGIGTSSRRAASYTVGVLVQSNFGGDLQVLGVPIRLEPNSHTSPDGSIMIVVATDAPLSPRNLGRLGERALLAIGRVGGWMSNGSGDYVIAFSAAESVRRNRERRTRVSSVEDLPNDLMSPLFQAAVEATEESIYNSLFMARTVEGHRGTATVLPVADVMKILRERGVVRSTGGGRS